MNEVNIILTEKEDGMLSVRLITNAAEDSGPSIVAKMFLEYVAHLQEQEQTPKIITGE